MKTFLSWVKAFLYWVFFALATLLWWKTLLNMRYWLWPWLGVDNLIIFPTLCLTALAGCWASVRFGWKAARFPLFLVLFITSAFAVQMFFPFRALLSIAMIPYMIILLGGLGGFGIFSLSTFLYTVLFLTCVGYSLCILHKNGSLSSPLLFVSCFTGLVISAHAASRLGLLLLYYVLPLQDMFMWREFFFPLPFLILLIYMHRKLMENEIFNQYKNTVAFSTGAFLILMTQDFFTISWGFIAASVSMGISIPLFNPLLLRQIAFLVSLVLWLQVFVFYAPDENAFKKWSWWARIGVGVLFFLWIIQIVWPEFFWHFSPNWFRI